MSESEQGIEQTAVLGDSAPTDGHAQEETQQGTGGAQPSFQDRVRSDPEYAWEQIRKRDATASSLANRLKELEPVEQVVRLAGGPDQLFSLAQLGTQYQQIRNVPGLEEVIQRSLATGRVDAGIAPNQNAQEEDDAWIDPEVKKVRNESREEILRLRQELQELRGLASGADVRARETGLRENVEKVLEDFGDHEDARQRAAEVMKLAVERAMRLASNGDRTQAELIRQLSEPGGINILRSVSGDVFREYFGPKAGPRQNIPAQDASGNGARRSTDERTVNPSRPGNTPLPPVPKGRVTDQSVLRIFEEVARRKGIDPRFL